MKAIVFDPEKICPIMSEEPKPVPGEGEVLVKIHAAALNHRDLHITNPANKHRFIYGSDGAGEIDEVGKGVEGWQPGEQVIINSQISCGHCYYCLSGEHSLCEEGRVLGGATWNGTFAEYVKVPAKNIMKKPAHLSFQEAAALPLAFGTAWRALMTQARIKPGETVFIQGIGGGVALFCLQIAVAIGARVIVSSGSDEKLNRAIQLGAQAGINYQTEDIIGRIREITNHQGVDLVLSSSGVSIPLGIAAARKKGRLVHFAYLGQELTHFPIDTLMSKQVALIGSAMHTYSEFVDGLNFIHTIQLKPVISEILPLGDAQLAFQKMKEAKQFGKIVLSIN